MTLLAFPVLLAFWVFVGWRVRVERGRVHSSLPAHVRLARAFRRLERELGLAFYAIAKETARRMAAFVEAYKAAAEEIGADLALELGLPDDGYIVGLDLRPLLPDSEGGTE